MASIIRSAGIGRGSNVTTTRRLIKVAKWTMAGLVVISLFAWIAAPRNNAYQWGPYVVSFGDNTVRMYRALLDGNYGWVSPKPLVSLWLWSAPAITLALTAVLFLIDRRRRIPAGCCRKCGYDLRGAVSDRCSECGAEITSGAAR